MANEVAFATPTPPQPQPLPSAPSQPGFFGSFSFGGLAAAQAVSAVQALFKPYRAIGFVLPEVVIEEAGRDDLEITQHPVERGASITDHAFMRPCEIVIRAGWSNALALPGYIQSVYKALLDLQSSRQPFTVYTGKRVYPDMLLCSLAQTTDSFTENALMVTAVCRQVILVQTAVATVALREQQAQPQNTAPTETGAPQQPVARPNVSLLRQGASALGF